MLTVKQAITMFEQARDAGWGDSPVCLDDATGFVSPFLAAAGLANASETGRVVILRLTGDSYEENGDPMDQAVAAFAPSTDEVVW